MMSWLKYVIAFALAFLLMLLFRTLAFSVHSITGDGLAPLYQDGDLLLVNRCSYGLRIEGNGILPYSRLMQKPVEKGDIVVFSVSTTAPDVSPLSPSSGQLSGLMIARCAAIPGDTILTNKGTLTIPGRKNCADADYYWLEAINQKNPIDSRHLGFIHERQIVGRVATILFNRYRLPLIHQRLSHNHQLPTSTQSP